jgi:hypothetical protein
MLRGNLSSRPFYNEQLVSAGLAVVGMLALALTAFNGYKLYSLSAERSMLKQRIAHDAAQAQEIERGAVTLQRAVDRQTLAQLAGSTQEANALIDARTFSWTTFFGMIEKTMPMDLRLVAVAPRIDKGTVKVTMSVVARKVDDIETFVDALQDTGAFRDVIQKVTDRNEEDSTYHAEVVCSYLPAGRSDAPARARPARGGGRGQP